ncbi:replication restart helicase PriA [Patulibacter medicamentivorans]|uniref:replication restart helicase PriA n=1 Tax=Patulibacter medicamentivorans TaxID=1097667 RepID=UPI0014787383|nr:primosomal protein N' [Patulibacter medicamentivorans]
MPAVARVEPLVTARAVRGPFDYLLPDGCDVGSVVEIPFGRQRLRGVITELAERSEHRLKAPSAVLDVSLPPELVRLALWMADDVVSTRARCLELLLPPDGVGERIRLWAERAGEAAVDPAADDPDAERYPGVRLTANQRALLDRLPGWTGDDLQALRRLEGRGLVTIEPRGHGRRPDHVALGAAAGAPVLNPDQLLAVQRLEDALRGAGGTPGPGEDRFLLHGVTGSGKTEVYLQAAQRALAMGRTALVLVPEIALTPQTVARFRSRLGETVAVLHSGLSKGERRDEWWRLRRGEARICVGPMSTVFAPVSDLGLVIVDEEHDSAYKQDGDPRYDARRVAAWRARENGAVLVVGSATPRPESWNALRRIGLPRRADGGEMPAVRLVDVRGIRTVLQREVHQALTDARKAIVLLNRRGWATWLECADCGHSWECPNCDVSLVLHRGSGVLRCHHCGHVEHPPRQCPACGSVSVGQHGLGTEQLADHLPGHVFRLDADVRDRSGVLQRFQEADHGILVGTQMIAKGHDFPDVELGVVVDADATLRFPDFRSQERTFQLVAQLAGRAGRGGGPSGARASVLVQTRSPEDRALRHAARHDAHGFLVEELERRRQLDYPPFSTLVRVMCEHEDEDRAQAAASVLRERMPEGTLGPVPVFRRQGRFRRQLLLKAAHRGSAVAAVRAAVESVVGTPGARGLVLAVEVDPR